MKNTFSKKGLWTNVTLALTVYIIMIIFGKDVIKIFNANPKLIHIGYKSIVIYGISFIFAAINIVFTTYYLATKRTKQSIIIAILRSFVINTIFIFLIPLLFGESTIWFGIILAEVIVVLIALVLNKKMAFFIDAIFLFSIIFLHHLYFL